MDKSPILRQYVVRLKDMGCDRLETLKFITPQDVANVNILVGHRCLLLNEVKSVLGVQ